MPARSIVAQSACGRVCPVCEGAMEMEAIGEINHWQCTCCPRCEPVTATEVGSLRRYAQSWDRRANALRKRVVG
jgi:Zn-finger nucleic acid-binding protein